MTWEVCRSIWEGSQWIFNQCAVQTHKFGKNGAHVANGEDSADSPSCDAAWNYRDACTVHVRLLAMHAGVDSRRGFMFFWKQM